MNYYDELGLSRSASTAEIQQAYRSLVKIIHPDQQRDETQKRLADLQLRRLNIIADTLTDPDKRRFYDASLINWDSRNGRKAVSDGDRPMRVRVKLKAHARVLAAVPLAIALVVGLIWLLKGPLLGYSKPGAAASVKRVEPAEKRVAKPILIVVPDEPRQVASAQPPSGKPDPFPAAAQQSVPAQLVKATEAPAAEASRVAVPPNLGLAGQWRSPGPARQSIELNLKASPGKLLGEVRAKSLAAAQEVRFHFEGPPGDRTMLLPWTSAHGSRGEVRLKRVTDKQIEMTWITTEGSASEALPETGTAVLMRSGR